LSRGRQQSVRCKRAGSASVLSHADRSLVAQAGLVAAFQQHLAFDSGNRPTRPRARHCGSHLLPHRAVELFPVPSMGVVAAPGESSVGLPRHPGCARGHRRGRNPIGARQAVERLPEPLLLAAVSFGEAGHRADHSGAFGLGNVGAAIHRILQCPQLVPLPVGFRVGPLPLGLRGGRFGAAPRRGEVARHRLRAADEDRRGRCAHRGAMERKS
jgi:hypothetical protein